MSQLALFRTHPDRQDSYLQDIRDLFIVEVSKPCTNGWLWMQRSHRGGEHERISTRATAGGTEFEGFPSGKLADANWIPIL